MNWGQKEKPEPKRAKSHRLYTVAEVLGCRTTDFLMNWKVVSWLPLASLSTRIGSGPHKDERLPGAASRPGVSDRLGRGEIDLRGEG